MLAECVGNAFRQCCLLRSPAFPLPQWGTARAVDSDRKERSGQEALGAPLEHCGGQRVRSHDVERGLAMQSPGTISYSARVEGEPPGHYWLLHAVSPHDHGIHTPAQFNRQPMARGTSAERAV